MATNYIRNHSSQEENNKSHNYTLNSSTNNVSISDCNIDIYNHYDLIQDDSSLLFSKKDLVDIATDSKNIKRVPGPNFVRVVDKTYSKPLDKVYLATFLLHDSRYKELKLMYLQILTEFVGTDGTTQLSRAYLASRMRCHVDTVSAISEWFVDKGIITKRRTGYIGKNGKLVNDYSIICLQRLKDAIRYAREENKEFIKKFRKILIKYGLLLLDKFISSIKVLKWLAEIEWIDPKYRKEKEIFYEYIKLKKKKKSAPDIPI